MTIKLLRLWYVPGRGPVLLCKNVFEQRIHNTAGINSFRPYLLQPCHDRRKDIQLLRHFKIINCGLCKLDENCYLYLYVVYTLCICVYNIPYLWKVQSCLRSNCLVHTYTYTRGDGETGCCKLYPEDALTHYRRRESTLPVYRIYHIRMAFNLFIGFSCSCPTQTEYVLCMHTRKRNTYACV